MTVALALLVVVGFVFVVLKTGVIGHASDARERARASVRVVRDPSLSDDEKERHLRRGAGPLFALFARIVASSVLSLALPLGGVWLLDRVGVGSLDDVIGLLVRIDFLVAVSVAGILAWWIVKRVKDERRG